MVDLEARASAAEELWKTGFDAEENGDHQAAYALFTEAHDLIMDCAKLHQYSHVQLRT